MQHIDHYNYFYTKYYSKTESLIKKYLIKNKKFKLAFHYLNPKIQLFINDYLENIFKDETLKISSKEFRAMWNFYESDEIQECLNYEMKQIFFLHEKSRNGCISPTEQFHNEYNKYVKKLALHEVLSEITKLLNINSSVLEMYYKLGDFSIFEIKDYGSMPLEDTEVYKTLSDRLYPINDEIEYATTENFNANHLTTIQKTLLLEYLIVNVNWSNLSDRKKSKFISIIIDKNDTNIRGTLAKLEKKPSENKENFNSDVLFIENLIKSMA